MKIQIPRLGALCDKPRWIIGLALAGLSLITGLFCLHAAWAGASGQAHLKVSDSSIQYGGYETHEMYVDDSIAYCAEPTRKTPDQGTYSKQTISPQKSSSGYSYDKRTVAAVLWFGWGGPGFDASLWPRTWYDDSAMNAQKYWALTHIVLSDFYTADHQSALYGCSSEFSSWAKGVVLSYDSAKKPYVASATQSKIRERISEVPQDFIDACYQLGTGSKSQVVVSFESGGWIDLDKDSANSSITSLNKSYSLKDTTYGIYRSANDAKNNSGCVQVLKTDENGYAKSSYLKRGTYYIKELSAGKGYELDQEIYAVATKHNKVARVHGEHVYDTPAADTPDVIVAKMDAQTLAVTPLGNASFENAEFTIDYYDSLFETENAARNSGDPTRTWKFKTNAQGEISLQNTSQLLEGELYYTTDGKVALPLGTYLITETKPPAGYLRNTETTLRTITQSQGLSAQGSFGCLVHDSAVREQVIRGGVSFKKLDAESREAHPLGSGTLDALFEIVNASEKAIWVSGALRNPGEVVYTAQAQKNQDGTYIFSTDTDQDGSDYLLPYGTYRIKEKLPGQGYLSTTQEIEFSITHDGEVVQIEDGATFANQIKRGDVEFIKTQEADMARLKHVPFKITSETTGESHILITDENGYASSAADWNKHSENTNANDFLMITHDRSNNTLNPDLNAVNQSGSSGVSSSGSSPSTGEMQDSSSKSINPEAGLWFGWKANKTATPPRDELGALPFDTYTIEELRCEANQGLELITLQGIAIKRDKTTIKLGTLDNRSVVDPYLYTSASNGIATHRMLALHNEAHAIDRVEYGGLTPNQEYTITSSVYDNTAKELIPNATASLSFTPTKSTGAVTMDIPLNTQEIQGHSLTVFEELTSQGETLVTHHDPQNTEQALVVASPTLSTKARDAVDGDQVLCADGTCTIVDTVYYQQLTPNQEYTLIGTLVNKASNEEVAKAQTSFTPTQEQGSEKVTFTFDDNAIKEFNAADNKATGNTNDPAVSVQLVACETLMIGDVEVCKHNNLEDANQTVELIKPNPPLDPEDPVPQETLPEEPIEEPSVEDGEASIMTETGDNIKPLAMIPVGGAALVAALWARQRMGASARKASILARMSG